MGAPVEKRSYCIKCGAKKYRSKMVCFVVPICSKTFMICTECKNNYVVLSTEEDNKYYISAYTILRK